MQYLLNVFLVFAVIVSRLLQGNEPEEEDLVQINSAAQETIYVSLGSYCEVGHALRACGLRKAAFPFDWIVSFDGELLITILQDNFQHFLDDNHLVVGDRGPGPLLNTYYHLEFLHDGDFRGELFLPTLEKFKTKYQKRIERFKRLADYRGKVVFMRTANEYSLTDPHRYYFCAENVEISDEYAWRLYTVLQQFFPLLNFTLVIINNHDGKDVFVEKKLCDRLVKIRSHPGLDISLKKKCFLSL